MLTVTALANKTRAVRYVDLYTFGRASSRKLGLPPQDNNLMLVPLCFLRLAGCRDLNPHCYFLSPAVPSSYRRWCARETHRLRLDEGIRALELHLDLRNGGRYVIGRIPLVRADALHDILECFLKHDGRLLLLQTPFEEIRPLPTARTATPRFSELQLLLLLRELREA